jgi:acyl-coenzyme A synthetase/AMP-(fatty) acid ligase
VKSLPMREAAMFKDKNMKWTAGDYKMYADAHANCLLEYRMKKGDKVALWMEASHHKVLR